MHQSGMCAHLCNERLVSHTINPNALVGDGRVREQLNALGQDECKQMLELFRERLRVNYYVGQNVRARLIFYDERISVVILKK